MMYLRRLRGYIIEVKVELVMQIACWLYRFAVTKSALILIQILSAANAHIRKY